MSLRCLLPWIGGLLLLGGCDLTLPWATSRGARAGDVTADPPRLEFAARIGAGTPASQVLTIRSRGGRPVGITYDFAFIASLAPAGDGLVVQPAPPELLGAGMHQSELRLWLCDTGPAGCTRPGPVVTAIPLTYVVEPSLLSLTPSSVTLEYLELATQHPSATLTIDDPQGPGPWSAEIVRTSTCPFANLFLPATSGITLPAQLTVQAYTFGGAPLGECTAEVRVTRGPAVVSAPVTIVHRYPLLGSSPQQVELAGVSYQQPLAPPQVVTVTSDAGPFPIWTSVSPADWLEIRQISSDPLQFSVVVTRSDLAPGSYTATFQVQPAATGAPAVTIPVRYTLTSRALGATPFLWAQPVDSRTLPSDLLLPLALSDSGAPLTWAVTTTAPWLAVSPASGVTGPGAQATLGVLPAELEALSHGTHGAQATFAYEVAGGGSEQFTVPVELQMLLPRYDRIMPRTVAAGRVGRAAAYGEGVGYFLLDGSPVSPLSYAPRWAHYDLPALAEGSYPIVVDNALGLQRSRATLQVLAPIGRSATAIASPGRKTRLVLDDAAATLYAPNPGEGTLDRYRASAGWARETLAIAGLRDAALAPDGGSVAAVAGGEVKMVDAAAFALAAAQPAAPAIPETGASGMDWRFVYSIDGTALLIRADAEAGVYAFDGTAVVPALGSPRGWGEPAVAGDGLGIWIARAGPTALPLAIYRHDSREYGAGGIPFAAHHVAADRGGVYFLFVRDGSASATSDSLLLDARYPMTLAGKLPATTANAVLTQDGARAVAWDPPAGKVRIFDLRGALVSGQFPEVGSGIAPAGDPGAGAVLTLSVDDRTLFLAGDERMAVVPLP